ncbi:MAG: uroporphyrinogen-III synthase [Rhodobacteraceae bacterium]|nr:uroporphyrinogen-III synthase [Paracoccaceae bacterium]
MTQPITLLMTRPNAASVRFVGQLPDTVRAHLNVCYAPLIRIAPLVDQITLGNTSALIFTSANAVELASALVSDRTLPVFCVGTATTQAAKNAGWTAQFAGTTANALIKMLTTLRPVGPMLHLCGVHTRGDIPKRLTTAGIKTTSLAIYDQITEPLTDQANAVLKGMFPVIVPLFSPRTARQFANLATIQAPIWLAALSKEVTKPLNSLDYQKILVCDQPDSASMCRTIERLVNAAGRVETGPSAK